MSWQIVRLADVVPQAWKNGGGSTRELLAWPSGADWRVRLSVATVMADGPFSHFEGVQRWFAVLQGDGVRLSVDGTATELRAASPPFSFAGAAQTSCALLGGPTLDFNLMLRGATGQLLRVNQQYSQKTDDLLIDNTIIFAACYAINTSIVSIFNQNKLVLAPGTLAWQLLDQQSAINGEGWSVESGNALWMGIRL